jgi:hypothetical protein
VKTVERDKKVKKWANQHEQLCLLATNTWCYALLLCFRVASAACITLPCQLLGWWPTARAELTHYPMDGPDCIYVKQTKTPTGCTAILLANSLTTHAKKKRKKERRRGRSYRDQLFSTERVCGFPIIINDQFFNCRFASMSH